MLSDGLAPAVKAYGELVRILLPQLNRVERSQLIETFTATDLEEKPGLYLAMRNGHASAVKAYGEVLQLLLPRLHDYERSLLINTLDAKNAGGISGFYRALQTGDISTVVVYGEILQALFFDGDQGLLINAPKTNLAALYFSSQMTHNPVAHGTERAFRSILPQLHADERSQWVSLLAAKRPGGMPAIYSALKRKHTAVVVVYGNIVKRLPEVECNKLIDMLEATDENSAPELYEALNEGDEVLAKLHQDLLKLTAKWRPNPNKRKIAVFPLQEVETSANNPKSAKLSHEET
jgi:hypothetical protein